MSDVLTETKLAKVVHVVEPGTAYPPLEAYASIEVVINRGSRQVVKLGDDRFLIFGKGSHITDPDSRAHLGELELVRGRGEVVHVQDQRATVRTIERRRTKPAKRIVREGGFMAHYIGGIMPSRSDRVVEEKVRPETDLPFEAVRLGDLAKPI
jgi:hypothetical protein